MADKVGMAQGLRRKVTKLVARSRRRARRTLPPGLRLPAGLVLIVGGVFGFLPILGFWMVPLGVAVAALDARPLWRWMKGKNRHG